MNDYPPLTVQKAATMAGTSPTTIKRKIASGEIPATQNARGHYLIEHSVFMDYLSQQAPTGRSGATRGDHMDASNGRPERTIPVLERELERAHERLRSLEERNERLQTELISLMHELKAALTEKGKHGLSAWFSKVRGLDR